MADIRLLKTEASNIQDRVVSLLEDALAEAKSGKVTGVFLFTENSDGGVSHSRDGMSDSLVVFWMELTKRRIMEGY